MKKQEKQFTLIELLVVLAIIGILSAVLLPALGRARQKAHESNCWGNLSQVGKALTMYRDDNDDEMSPWLSTLIPDYLQSAQVLRCKADANDGSTPVENWDSHWYDGGDFDASYDRPGNTGVHVNPADVGRISYFYECSDALCNWGINGITANTETWAKVKESQRLEGDGNNGNVPYDDTLFPVTRCFWHVRNKDKNAPVINVAYAGNIFFSKLEWEKGVWTP